jgi:hypothetical protein
VSRGIDAARDRERKGTERMVDQDAVFEALSESKIKSALNKPPPRIEAIDSYGNNFSGVRILPEELTVLTEGSRIAVLWNTGWYRGAVQKRVCTMSNRRDQTELCIRIAYDDGDNVFYPPEKLHRLCVCLLRDEPISIEHGHGGVVVLVDALESGNEEELSAVELDDGPENSNQEGESFDASPPSPKRPSPGKRSSKGARFSHACSRCGTFGFEGEIACRSCGAGFPRAATTKKAVNMRQASTGDALASNLHQPWPAVVTLSESPPLPGSSRSGAPSSLAPRTTVDATSEASGSTGDEPQSTWIQCNACEKWRRLPSQSSTEPDLDIWVCAMNADTQFAACDIAEEEMGSDEELDSDTEMVEVVKAFRPASLGEKHKQQRAVAPADKSKPPTPQSRKRRRETVASQTSVVSHGPQRSAEAPRLASSAGESPLSPDGLEALANAAAAPAPEEHTEGLAALASAGMMFHENAGMMTLADAVGSACPAPKKKRVRHRKKPLPLQMPEGSEIASAPAGAISRQMSRQMLERFEERWTPEEDRTILELVAPHQAMKEKLGKDGRISWTAIADAFPFRKGVNRVSLGNMIRNRLYRINISIEKKKKIDQRAGLGEQTKAEHETAEASQSEDSAGPVLERLPAEAQHHSTTADEGAAMLLFAAGTA